MDQSIIDKKQKLLLEYCFSNPEVFTKIYHLLNPDYFEKPLDIVVFFVNEYYQEFHGIPNNHIIEAETEIQMDYQPVSTDSEKQYVIESIEEHCQNEAMRKAILQSAEYLQENNFDNIFNEIKQALTVKVDKSLGIEVFDNPEERLTHMEENLDSRNIGIPKFDELIGNISRGDLGIICAGTAGGKSLMLSNIAYLMSAQELNVLIISLELNEELTSKRLDAISTSIPISDLLDNIEDVTAIHQQHQQTHGSITVKKMRSAKATPTRIRSFIMEYQIEKGYTPDVIVLDYLDIMKPDNRYLQGKFDIDEHMTLELKDIMEENDCYGFTASQLNREAADKTDLHYGMIAGGLSKVNASDWCVAMYATDDDVDNNVFNVTQFKVRNTSKSTQDIQLYINPNNLIISDSIQKVRQKKNPSLSKNRGTVSHGKDQLQQHLKNDS